MMLGFFYFCDIFFVTDIFRTLFTQNNTLKERMDEMFSLLAANRPITTRQTSMPQEVQFPMASLEDWEVLERVLAGDEDGKTVSDKMVS